jgi:hypothetical protein
VASKGFIEAAFRVNANAKLYLSEFRSLQFSTNRFGVGLAQRLAGVALQAGLSGFVPNRLTAFRPSGFDP